jgi:Ser/Thr protein kinase RdoA (MazF antagonist)
MTPTGWDELAGRFGLGEVLGSPAYVTRGAMGEIWRLETSKGRWAVKWQFPWAPVQPHPADVRVQLAAAAAGIPLPRPVLTRDGAAVARAKNRHARVYEWVDLAQPVDLPADSQTAAEAGRLLGVLHSLALSSDEPDDPWYVAVPPPQAWAGLAGRAAAAGLAWAGQLAGAQELIAGLSARAAVPRHSGQRIVCHRDFNPDNVVPTAAGDHLVVLDWEEAGPLDPRCELGYTLFAWSAGQGQVSTTAITALLDSYSAALGTSPALGPGMFTTAIAAHLNFLRVMAEQAIAEPDHRDYAERQIASLLDHDLADLATFLDVAGHLLGSTPHGRPGTRAGHAGPSALAPSSAVPGEREQILEGLTLMPPGGGRRHRGSLPG